MSAWQLVFAMREKAVPSLSFFLMVLAVKWNLASGATENKRALEQRNYEMQIT